MDADRPLTGRLSRFPPLDGAIEDLRALLTQETATLAERLAESFGARGAALVASGREALRLAFVAAALRTGRDEAVLPAYTCWSVAAAAVAAGLRVRLVDVDARGWIDVDALHALPLERAACVVVSNLFGVAEPLATVDRVARERGVLVVDDAAQSAGARSDDGRAGGRGALGVLSFARGKPLQALGGGVLLWRDPDLAPAPVAVGRPRRARAWLRAVAWNLALSPPAFAALAAAPGLGVGATRFDPQFRRGPIDGASLVLCAHALERSEARRRRREDVALALAREVVQRSAFEPLCAPPPGVGAYPRLALLAPDRGRRDAAIAALSRLGVGTLYPAPLDAIPLLAPALVQPAPCPGARALCDRLLTLPTHGGLSGARLEQALRRLAELAPLRGTAQGTSLAARSPRATSSATTA